MKRVRYWIDGKVWNIGDVLFSDGAPNAQVTSEKSSKLKLVTFKMCKPNLSDSNQMLSFKVHGIGKKSKDLLNGLENKWLSDTAILIGDTTNSVTKCIPNFQYEDMLGTNQTGAILTSVNRSDTGWNNTKCPHGKMDIERSSCALDQLVPLI